MFTQGTPCSTCDDEYNYCKNDALCSRTIADDTDSGLRGALHFSSEDVSRSSTEQTAAIATPTSADSFWMPETTVHLNNLCTQFCRKVEDCDPSTLEFGTDCGSGYVCCSLKSHGESKWFSLVFVNQI